VNSHFTGLIISHVWICPEARIIDEKTMRQISLELDYSPQNIDLIIRRSIKKALRNSKIRNLAIYFDDIDPSLVSLKAHNEIFYPEEIKQLVR